MKNLGNSLFLICACLFVWGCSENYSNGERIGLVTQFSRTGIFWKSWEGHLNLTQTGMNSTSLTPFDFSIDNDREQEQGNLIKTLDSAAQFGWKIKLVYHETVGKNWFSNRGGTSHFVSDVEVLDKNLTKNTLKENFEKVRHDTIYLVIYKNNEDQNKP